MTKDQSQVARLKQEIEATCASMQLLFNGYAQKASHKIITNQYKTLDQQCSHLATLVGEEAATETICKTYNTIVH